jgi:hypothetical protein
VVSGVSKEGLRTLNPQKKGKIFLQRVRNHLPSNTASHPRRPESSLKQNESSLNVFTQIQDENIFLIHYIKFGVGFTFKLCAKFEHINVKIVYKNNLFSFYALYM